MADRVATEQPLDNQAAKRHPYGMAILQFIAVTVLGLLVAWLVGTYFGAVGKNWTTTGIALAALFSIGFIVDRMQAKKRQGTRD
jgi:L-asparagine transporter-like permease